MSLDEVLMIVATRQRTCWRRSRCSAISSRGKTGCAISEMPLAILGCVAQFAQLVARFELTGVWPLLNLYGSLSLFAAMSVAIYIGFAFRYRLWFAGGFVLAMAAIFLAYGVTWNEGHDAGRTLAAVLLGEDSRSARGFVVRRVFGRVRIFVHLSREVLRRAHFRRRSAVGHLRNRRRTRASRPPASRSTTAAAL